MPEQARTGWPRRALVVGALLVFLAAALTAAFEVIGSRVDTEGVLHEPFVLIPLAWTSGLAGAALLGLGCWRRARVRRTRAGTPGAPGRKRRGPTS